MIYRYLISYLYRPILTVMFYSLLVPETCSAVEIFWSDKDAREVWRADANGANPTLLFNATDSLQDPRGVAIDVAAGQIYIADHVANTGIIYQGSLDGDGSLTPIITGIDEPADILLDLPNNKIYWAAQNGSEIKRADISGANEELIVGGLASEPYYLALDSQAGFIFWSDFNSSTIHRADLNAASPTPTNFITGLSRVRDIELDLVNRQIYWADRNAPNIARRNLDGPGSIEILFNSGDGLGRPHGIALDVENELIFWTDTTTGDVLSGNINGIGSPTTINNGPTSDGPWAIVVPEPTSATLLLLGVLSIFYYGQKRRIGSDFI